MAKREKTIHHIMIQNTLRNDSLWKQTTQLESLSQHAPFHLMVLQ